MVNLWDGAAARGAGGKEFLEAEVAELRGPEDYVHAVAWSPDGTRLLSAAGDRQASTNKPGPLQKSAKSCGACSAARDA